MASWSALTGGGCNGNSLNFIKRFFVILFRRASIKKSPSIPLWLLALVLPVLFQSLVYRKRGSYHYRLTLFIINISIASLYGMLASIVLPLFGKQHLILWSATKVLNFLNKHLLAVEGVIVDGDEKNYAKDDELAIYVCNHQTMLDLLFMGACTPKRVTVAIKREIKYYPLLGQFMTLMNAIFLDRGNRTDAVRVAQKAAAEIHEKQLGVWLFPEGTRSGGQEVTLLPFKKGAFYMATQAKVPIIPIVMANYKHIYDAEKRHFGHGTVKIRVLPAVHTKNVPEDSASVDKLANEVRKRMLTALKEISIPTKDGEASKTQQTRNSELGKL